MVGHHLAQLNVAVLKHPLWHPALAPFVNALDAVNAVAEKAPGFVWRLIEDEGNNATDIRPWGDDMIVNLSVWRDIEALESYVYAPDHADVLRQRRSFFVPMDTPHVVLWWVPEGHLPDLVEARDRLDRLAADGPTPYAFSLRSTFPPGAPVPA
jgi:hypothetical protein